MIARTDLRVTRIGKDWISCMDKFGLVLRTVVFFLFPIPFLLDFAVSHGEDWTGIVAYVAVAVLAAGAATAAWAATRRGE
jgi:hypothetical protein